MKAIEELAAEVEATRRERIGLKRKLRAVGDLDAAILERNALLARGESMVTAKLEAELASLVERREELEAKLARASEMAQAVKTLPGLTGLEQLEIAAGLADGNDVLITAGVVIKSGMTREVVEAIQRSRGVRRGDR